MWVLPLAATIVAFVFAGLLAKHFGERRRPFQLLWLIALAMYGVASLAVTAGVAGEWSRLTFQVYWALGACLNVPFLAAGELTLLFRGTRVVWACVFVLALMVAYTVFSLNGAAMSPEALTEQLPLGREVFGDGTAPHRLAQILSYPAYTLLLVGALWSAWRMRERPELKDRFVGTLLIAAGATIVAGGAAFAALGVMAGFIGTLAAGIAVMFWGFLRASRQPSAAAS